MNKAKLIFHPKNPRTAPFPRILIPSDFPNPISRPRGVRGYPRGIRGVSERENEGIRASFRGGSESKSERRSNRKIREAIGFDKSETPSDLRVFREATGF